MITVTDYTAADRDSVRHLLADLPLLYPDAAHWLERRLDQCETGHASCLIAREDGEPAGVLIQTPKPDGRVKISTIYVADRRRRSGIGHALLARASAAWAESEAVYVTVAMEHADAIGRLTARYGFQRVAVERDRYGRGRHEVILQMQPARYLLALRSHHAKRIYAGTKTWEFRRVHAKIPVGATVLIYESGGVGMVTGQFTVADIRHGSAEVVTLEPDMTSRRDAAEYLAGAARATALRTSQVTRYAIPLSLASLGVARAPQSYQRV